jgi:hypothetical protein
MMNRAIAASSSASERRWGAGESSHALGREAGQRGKQLARDGPEEALQLAAPLRHARGGVHKLDAQVDACLVEVVAGEVRPVVAVEDVGDPAHRPRRVALAPDRLPERQRVCSVDGASRLTP